MRDTDMPKKTKKSEKESPKKSALKKTVRRSGPARPRAASTSKVSSRTRKKPAVPARSVVTEDDIALAAYYIGERRRHLGLPGDERSDWWQAERQLRG